MFSLVPLTASFEYKILDLLLTAARELSLVCYLIHEKEGKRKIHVLRMCILEFELVTTIPVIYIWSFLR